METKFSQTEVVVVGGGMAGLTAACYLARKPIAVTVIEKASYLGARQPKISTASGSSAAATLFIPAVQPRGY